MQKLYQLPQSRIYTTANRATPSATLNLLARVPSFLDNEKYNCSLGNSGKQHAASRKDQCVNSGISGTLVDFAGKVCNGLFPRNFTNARNPVPKQGGPG